MEWSNLLNDNLSLFCTRLLIALVLSGLIGFERELKNHSAGFRTHILVGVGACLMMLLSLYGFETYMEKYSNVRFDPARIPSYVISGIGFLGAGTIIVNGMTIKGLTTAASIWTVAGIGLVVGAGMYDAAILTTILVLLSLVFLNNVEEKYLNNHLKNTFQIIVDRKVKINELLLVFEDIGVSIRRVEIENESKEQRKFIIELDKDQKYDRSMVLDRLSKVEHVLHVDH